MNHFLIKQLQLVYPILFFAAIENFAILAHHSFHFKSTIYPQLLNLNDVGLQAVSFEINNNGLVHVVTCVYNPPALITNDFKTITDLIDHICLTYHFVIFIGDFN